MLQIFLNILPIFIIIALGYILKKFWISSETFWSGIGSLAACVFLPSQLFSVIVNAKLDSVESSNMLIAILISTSIIAVSNLALQTKYIIPANQFGCIVQGNLRYNGYVFLGLGATLGHLGTQYVALINVYMMTFVNIFITIWHGVFIKKTDSQNRLGLVLVITKSILINPLLIGIILAVLINYYKIKLPQFISTFADSMGSCALGIGSLSIGASLKLKIKKEYVNPTLIASLIKLIALPIITFILLRILNVEGIAKAAAMLYSCCPVGNSAVAFAKQLGGDAELMSTIVSTVLVFSIFTIPFIMQVFGM